MSRKRITERVMDWSRTWINSGYVRYGYNRDSWSEKINIDFHIDESEGKQNVIVKIRDNQQNGFDCFFDEVDGLQSCVMKNDLHI